MALTIGTLLSSQETNAHHTRPTRPAAGQLSKPNSCSEVRQPPRRWRPGSGPTLWSLPDVRGPGVRPPAPGWCPVLPGARVNTTSGGVRRQTASAGTPVSTSGPARPTSSPVDRGPPSGRTTGHQSTVGTVHQSPVHRWHCRPVALSTWSAVHRPQDHRPQDHRPQDVRRPRLPRQRHPGPRPPARRQRSARGSPRPAPGSPRCRPRVRPRPVSYSCSDLTSRNSSRPYSPSSRPLPLCL